MIGKSDCHTYEYGNAIIVVHRPVLDEQQLEKRKQQLHRALVNYGMSAQNDKKNEVSEWESSR